MTALILVMSVLAFARTDRTTAFEVLLESFLHNLLNKRSEKCVLVFDCCNRSLSYL